MYIVKGCKNVQNWGGGGKCVLGHSDKFCNRQDGQIKNNPCRNAYLGFIFISEICVFRVYFESPFTRMISSLKYKCPRIQPVEYNNTSNRIPKIKINE